MADGLTTEQLQLAVSDPSFGPQHWAKLTPDEQARARPFLQASQGGPPAAPAGAQGTAPGIGPTPGATGLTGKIEELLSGAASGAADLGIGAAKGVGSTVTGLGNLARKIPGVDALDDVVPPVTFSTTPDNTTQSVGKGLEQAAEYLAPASGMRKAAIKGLVQYGIPDAASPGAMKVMNKLAAILGRSAGEAGSAATVSAAHGDSDPLTTGLIAGAIPPVTGALAKTAGPVLAKVAPFAAGAATWKALGGLGGLGAGMGAAGAVRSATKDVLTPQRLAALRAFIMEHAPQAMRAGLGAEEDARIGPQRTPVAPR